MFQALNNIIGLSLDNSKLSLIERKVKWRLQIVKDRDFAYLEHLPVKIWINGK